MTNPIKHNPEPCMLRPHGRVFLTPKRLAATSSGLLVRLADLWLNIRSRSAQNVLCSLNYSV